MAKVHPTAIVHSGAELAETVEIGPHAVIGEHVRIGADTTVGPSVVIDGHTAIGERNRIFPFASIGLEPQDRKYKGETAYVEIGNDNLIRESSTIQIGTEGGGLWTRVGNNNLLMTCSHVGHDSLVGDHCVIANCVPLAGHVVLEDYVILGGLSAVHQFCRLGAHSMAAAGSMVTMDVPPYCYAHGDHARLRGINSVGMSRRGYTPDQVREVKRVYSKVFRKALRFEDGVAAAREMLGPPADDGDELAPSQHLMRFLEAPSNRGVAPAGRG